MPPFAYVQLHHDRCRTVRVVCRPLVQQVASSLESAKNDGVLTEDIEVNDIAFESGVQAKFNHGALAL